MAAVLGRNGAGKSKLMRTISGSERYSRPRRVGTPHFPNTDEEEPP